jgi:hypothetical protein
MVILNTPILNLKVFYINLVHQQLMVSIQRPPTLVLRRNFDKCDVACGNFTRQQLAERDCQLCTVTQIVLDAVLGETNIPRMQDSK